MPPAAEDGSATLSFPGYGILFFWQAGVLEYLERECDLSRCTFVGSSAGALLSVLAACQVQPQAALDLAHELCVERGVFDRPLGLVGVWGGIVREWLHRLLPDDAAERCSGRVRLVLTTLPLLGRTVVDHFRDRDDLVDAALASAHLPLILDWRLAASWRGRRCVDGSALYILTRRCSALAPPSTPGRPLLLFDPFHDRRLFNLRTMMSCASLCAKDAAQGLLDAGVEYARRAHAEGRCGLASLPRKRRPPAAPAPAPAPAAAAAKGAALRAVTIDLVATCGGGTAALAAPALAPPAVAAEAV